MLGGKVAIELCFKEVQSTFLPFNGNTTRQYEYTARIIYSQELLYINYVVQSLMCSIVLAAAVILILPGTTTAVKVLLGTFHFIFSLALGTICIVNDKVILFSPLVHSTAIGYFL